MRTVNIDEAKTHFSNLVEEACQGQEIVISKSGKPMARLIGIIPAKPIRKPGFLKGKIEIADDFDAPLPSDILDAFEGRF